MSGSALCHSLPFGGTGAGRVTGGCWAAVLSLLLGCVGPLAAEGAFGARVAAELTGASAAREAEGWLQLEADQRAARARSEPLTLLQSQQFQIRERQERIRLRDVYQYQQREIDALSRAERRRSEAGRSGFDRRARNQALQLRQGRELEGLRLRQGMERERLGVSAGSYRRR